MFVCVCVCVCVCVYIYNKWSLNLLLIGKHPDAGKDYRKEEKGAAEDEMVGWHHRLNGLLRE